MGLWNADAGACEPTAVMSSAGSAAVPPAGTLGIAPRLRRCSAGPNLGAAVVHSGGAVKSRTPFTDRTLPRRLPKVVP